MLRMASLFRKRFDAAQAAARLQDRRARVRTLHLEPDPIDGRILALLVAASTSHRYDVERAETAEAARAALARRRFDLLIVSDNSDLAQSAIGGGAILADLPMLVLARDPQLLPAFGDACLAKPGLSVGAIDAAVERLLAAAARRRD